uniref:Uncharacterized protein n=1 Tax=Panagrolaimus sp. JU765 TaxID=591449 RepID=A0AC34Q7W1_9BILA
MNQMPPSTKNDQNEIKLSPKSPTKKNENIPSNKPINPEIYQIKPASENVDQQEKEKNSVIRQPQSPIPNKPAAPTIPNPEKKEISTKIDQNQNEKPPSEVKKVNELDATQENEIAKNQTPKEENKEKPREEHKSIKSKKQSRKDKLSEKKPQQEESEKFEEGDNNIKPTSENVDQQEKEKNSVIRQPQSPIPNKPAAPTIPNPEKKEISTKIDQNQNEKPPSEVKKSKKQSRKDKLSEKKPQQEESEKFEEGDNNVSREDPSMDDTLKGVGTEMPHFES